MTASLVRFLLTALAALPLACTATVPEADPDAAAAAPHHQRRCGWLQQRSTGEAVLLDRDGDWLLARGGEHRATGDWRASFAPDRKVTTGDGETGCACLTVQVDLATHRVVSAKAPQARPLAACRSDKTLDATAETRATPPARRVFRMPTFSFSYPADWHARRAGNCVALEEPGRSKEEEYTLQLCAKPGTLPAAADERFFSPGDDGIWMRSAGMQEPSPVDWMFGPGWSGMVATQICGVGDAETGFHAAGGTCLMFAGSDGRNAVLGDSVGYYQDFAQLRDILRSIRFAPAAKRR
ncbi:DUF4087 domain-containing protein [Aquabacterium sp. A7-Y]|uniref:DUF4087 domain-containing protein n=1 Tax=Aquabacterium sp. A7-Y TaxID=1349605 RepID=UPI00223C9AE4|nr:DUF4087 domain-containing protein [Aquabacterium sp. A7-Y]MCW7537996.1 DUF4087 domain-containing protein [Aquabacterium sp. A7-Y]